MPNALTTERVRAALAKRWQRARAAAWALRAGLVARRQLKLTGVGRVELPRAPDLPRTAESGVWIALSGSRRTCLERALVRQRWLAARGAPRDLLIGVKSGRPFAAHAWLDGDPPNSWAGYEELSRHPARVE